jgi:hypothetical protein
MVLQWRGLAEDFAKFPGARGLELFCVNFKGFPQTPARPPGRGRPAERLAGGRLWKQTFTPPSSPFNTATDGSMQVLSECIEIVIGKV